MDWDDSAEEDADAATAEAIEEARIGMARAAARDLRESRATRSDPLQCPPHDLAWAFPNVVMVGDGDGGEKFLRLLCFIVSYLILSYTSPASVLAGKPSPRFIDRRLAVHHPSRPVHFFLA